MNLGKNIIAVFFVIFQWHTILGQYHPIPDPEELQKLIKISNKVYKKANLPENDTSIVIFYGDLGCDNALEEKTLDISLFEQGIKFGYYTRKKCLFIKEKYLAPVVYYLNSSKEVIAYVDGEALVRARLENGHHMYPEKENFIHYVINQGYKNIFNLGCALDQFKYYAISSNGHPVVIDEFLFRKNKDPIIKISELK